MSLSLSLSVSLSLSLYLALSPSLSISPCLARPRARQVLKDLRGERGEVANVKKAELRQLLKRVKRSRREDCACCAAVPLFNNIVRPAPSSETENRQTTKRNPNPKKSKQPRKPTELIRSHLDWHSLPSLTLKVGLIDVRIV